MKGDDESWHSWSFLWRVEHTGAVDVTVGAVAAVLGSTVPFLEGANTDVLAEVDVAGDSSCKRSPMLAKGF